MQVIASVAFGIDVDSISDPNTDFRRYGRQVRISCTFSRRMITKICDIHRYSNQHSKRHFER